MGNRRRGSGGPAACGCLQSRALRGWEPTAGSLLPRSTSFPSCFTSLPLFPFSSPLISLHPASCLPVCLLCPFPLSPARSFSISSSSLPFPSSTFLSFPVFLSSFSRSPFRPLCLPSPLLFPSRYPVSHSSIPFLRSVPPPSLSPAPLRLPSSLGRERTVRCVSALEEEGR